METGEILDLFNLDASSSSTSVNPSSSSANKDEDLGVDATGEVKEKGKKGYLDDLGELWDERGYEEEFGMEGFLGRMKG